MSIYNTICCSRCGRELYSPLTVPEYREKNAIHFPGFYVVNDDNRQEEYCEKCFKAWKRSMNHEIKIKETILKIIWHIVFLVLCIPVFVKVAYWSIINKEYKP